MKHVLLSADGYPSVYSVPDIVADNLEMYCLDFCERWLRESPDAAEYRVDLGACIGFRFNEEDFVKYLNKWIFPDQPSILVETLEIGPKEKIPQKYEDCEWFNF
ncbi:MAG: hypothetical protein FWE98_06270 [Oscillospiraceae bacterium]|nr:hypothetical protein [Oscillospiraceae bacterium]